MWGLVVEVEHKPGGRGLRVDQSHNVKVMNVPGLMGAYTEGRRKSQGAATTELARNLLSLHRSALAARPLCIGAVV